MKRQLKRMQHDTYYQLTERAKHKVREKFGDISDTSTDSEAMTKDIDINVVQRTADDL